MPQGVHVGAQSDGRSGCPAVEDTDNPGGAADIFGDGEAGLTQFTGQKRRGLVFLETQFGYGVQKIIQFDDS